MENVKQIKVSAKTSVHQLAGSITICIQDGFDVELRAIGASAVNQAVKACAVARGNLAQKGKDVYVKPGFTESEDTNKSTVVLLKLIVK